MKTCLIIMANELRFINKFLESHIDVAYRLNYRIILISNVPSHQSFELTKLQLINRENYDNLIEFFNVSIPRNPSRIIRLLLATIKIHQIVIKSNAKIIHAHTPAAGIIARMIRIILRDKSPKIIYTAHGFHFFKGASILSWIFFFPIEKILSRFTDLIITINEEDYQTALKFFNSELVKINGIGVHKEILNFEASSHRGIIRFISVGELNKNKNHQIILKTLSTMKHFSWTYTLLGEGKLMMKLQKLSSQLKIEDRVFFLGQVNNVVEELNTSDIFIMPSLREGLPVSMMEAMMSPCLIIGSNIRGIRDLIVDNKGGYLFNPRKIEDLINVINKAINEQNVWSLMKRENFAEIRKFSKSYIVDEIKTIYQNLEQ